MQRGGQDIDLMRRSGANDPRAFAGDTAEGRALLRLEFRDAWQGRELASEAGFDPRL
ncbi:hypothetical protein U703_14840 [Rhodobacter capsulatus YW1]|nr:hypothetical protein U703_14840 [Rhodobacter capsulatus YW1]